MDDSSEDDEDASAPQIDYRVKTLPLWMINVDTDGCTFEDEENDEGGKGRSQCSDYREKLSLYGWLMSQRMISLKAKKMKKSDAGWRGSFSVTRKLPTSGLSVLPSARWSNDRLRPADGPWPHISSWSGTCLFLDFVFFVFSFFLVNLFLFFCFFFFGWNFCPFSLSLKQALSMWNPLPPQG